MHTRLKMVRESLRTEDGKKYSQTKLAEEMLVTRDMIATYESGRVEPTSLFISALCNKYNINPDWLATGQGEMIRPLSKEAEIGLIVASLYKDDDDAKFKRAIAKVLSEMNAEQIATLKDAIKKIVNAMDE